MIPNQGLRAGNRESGFETRGCGKMYTRLGVRARETGIGVRETGHEERGTEFESRNS